MKPRLNGNIQITKNKYGETICYGKGPDIEHYLEHAEYINFYISPHPEVLKTDYDVNDMIKHIEKIAHGIPSGATIQISGVNKSNDRALLLLYNILKIKNCFIISQVYENDVKSISNDKYTLINEYSNVINITSASIKSEQLHKKYEFYKNWGKKQIVVMSSSFDLILDDPQYPIIVTPEAFNKIKVINTNIICYELEYTLKSEIFFAYIPFHSIYDGRLDNILTYINVRYKEED